jgi:hypothetical protein
MSTRKSLEKNKFIFSLTDIGVRFFIPFIAGKIGWENRTFFLVGVLGMAFGRIGKNFTMNTNLYNLYFIDKIFKSFGTFQFISCGFGCIIMDWI